MNVASPKTPPAPPAPPSPPTAAADLLQPSDTFPRRHIGPGPAEQAAMLETLGLTSLEELTAQTIPAPIRLQKPLNLPGASHTRGEHELISELHRMARQNKVHKSFLGMGYYGTITPPVIQRNILENPGWYTQYTPYQAEISQGRLEALLNFQTMVCDLTALPLANASLLDEATAAAEAMSMCHAIGSDEPGKDTFFISENCHPQTIAVVQARAAAQGIKTVVGDETILFNDSLALPVIPKSLCGILVQYPGTDGRILDYSKLTAQAHDDDILIVAATDLLALTLIKPPGEWGGEAGGGADIAIGSAQRFGVPMGFGGPHAAFMATKSEYARKMPGRLVGVSKDVHGNPALRLALQTREQHIRREKATSNICTAQALLATMASMYAVYHGPEGLKTVAERVNYLSKTLAHTLRTMGYELGQAPIFDTMAVRLVDAARADAIIASAKAKGINLRRLDQTSICITFDETSEPADILPIALLFETSSRPAVLRFIGVPEDELPTTLLRTSPFLTHPVFNKYHSEHEMLRYIKRLESRDLSLTTSNIPLGSCTMKLNGTSEMLPVTWPEFAHLHPFAPADQTKGYQQLFQSLEAWLAEITGFAACSLQPNAGSQGEYAGLLVIRAYHEAQSGADALVGSSSPGATGLRSSQPRAGAVESPKSRRNICLIPTSAHGTNPASAVVAGLHVVPVACDESGNIDLADLRKKAAEHASDLACIMVTYPSTHGVFEESIKELCQIVHSYGGQVYMDGANMNAQVGLTSPGFIGADVCHLNLHKTFCIPHGGGGPGVGPICVAQHLAPFLPTTSIGVSEYRSIGVDTAAPTHSDTPTPRHPDTAAAHNIGPISAAPYGSASILPISWVYIALMGAEGLKQATQVAILNANYMAERLAAHYPVFYKGKNGRVAHEFILDCRQFEASAGVKVEDIAKRLMDYGFHAPTMSWPVPGTLMFEPTESESREELDRLCDAMIMIREEIRALEEGRADKADNALKHAPHTAHAIAADNWPHAYSRQHAAYPAPWTRPNAANGGHKFWPHVGRIDNPYGDRNLVCTCPPVEPA